MYVSTKYGYKNMDDYSKQKRQKQQQQQQQTNEKEKIWYIVP